MTYRSAITEPWAADFLLAAAKSRDSARVRELLVGLTLADPDGWLIAVSECVRKLVFDIETLEVISQHICIAQEDK